MRHRYTVIYTEYDSWNSLQPRFNRSLQVLAHDAIEAAQRARNQAEKDAVEAEDILVIPGWNKILYYSPN